MSERVVDPGGRPSREGYPLLVATLAARTATGIRAEMGRAAEAGADLIEVRLDRLPADEVPRLEHVHDVPITHPWVPAVATLRSRAEGGEGPDDLPARARILRSALGALPFTFVDLEVARDLDLVSELRRFEGRAISFVRSAHLPPGASPGEVERALALATRGGELGKVVLPALADRVVQELVPLARRYQGRPYVLHTTGPAGGLLRVLAPRLGMAWVYGRTPEGGSTAVGGPPEGAGASHGEVVEPSQIPVDGMRRYIDQGPEAPWFAIVGRPLGHTLSPALQASFLTGTGTDGIYIPLELAREEELMEVLPTLGRLGLRGVNVTRPFKLAAYRYARSRSESALACGAANTWVLKAEALLPPSGGKEGTGEEARGPSPFDAHNTDVDALERWWEELAASGQDLGRVLVVGAGGAARAAVAASVQRGAHVSVVARRMDAAEELVRDFPPEHVRVLPSPPVGQFPLVVHATPFGQAVGLELHVPLEKVLGPGTLLVDLVYAPRDPTLARLARARGARYEDGMRMLVYQAAASFRLFTGRDVPPALLAPWLTPPTGAGERRATGVAA